MLYPSAGCWWAWPFLIGAVSMNDLSAVIQSNSTGAAQQHTATQHLLAFTTACSQCTSVLENLPSLRDVAFDRLSGFLRGRVPVWNPDIIFLNGPSAPQTAQGSCSLTDALIQAMTSGAKAFDPKNPGFVLPPRERRGAASGGRKRLHHDQECF
jgi:hypothetical protein